MSLVLLTNAEQVRCPYVPTNLHTLSPLDPHLCPFLHLRHLQFLLLKRIAWNSVNLHRNPTGKLNPGLEQLQLLTWRAVQCLEISAQTCPVFFLSHS